MYAHLQGQMIGGGLAGSLVGAGAAMMDQTASRQPEVRAEMERMEKAVESIAQTADILTQRLTPVRSQIGNQTSGTGGVAPQPVLCDMANFIRGRRCRLEEVEDLLRRALNELEI